MPKRSANSHKPSAFGPKETIQGPPPVALPAVLSFLKDTRGAVTWTSRDLQDCLHIDTNDAKQILTLLEMQGYVQQKEGSGDYLTTASGESVSGSKLPRLKRERDEMSLAALSDRIAAMNRDPRSRFTIRKALAFGDFSSERPLAQAADVGVMLTRRNLESSDEQNDEEQRTLLDQLRARDRFLQVQRYQPWMSERSHRDLVAGRVRTTKEKAPG